MRSGCDFANAIFNLVLPCLLIGIFRSSYDNVLRWMPWDLTDDKSTLVQVMAWCRQARSHYLGQCWPRSVSPYGISRPQRVKLESQKILFVSNIQFDQQVLVVNHCLIFADSTAVWLPRSVPKIRGFVNQERSDRCCVGAVKDGF